MKSSLNNILEYFRNPFISRNTQNTQKYIGDKRPLGRWGIIYCNKKLNRRIDLSNTDHCGPCGSFVIQRKH